MTTSTVTFTRPPREEVLAQRAARKARRASHKRGWDIEDRPRDRRAHLRVKIVSLQAEQRLIRKEERRTRNGWTWTELREHRKMLGRESRCAQLAMAFIRGRHYRRVEASTKPGNAPEWNRVWYHVEQFGGDRLAMNSAKRDVERARFVAWQTAKLPEEQVAA